MDKEKKFIKRELENNKEENEFKGVSLLDSKNKLKANLFGFFCSILILGFGLVFCTLLYMFINFCTAYIFPEMYLKVLISIPIIISSLLCVGGYFSYRDLFMESVIKDKTIKQVLEEEYKYLKYR